MKRGAISGGVKVLVWEESQDKEDLITPESLQVRGCEVDITGMVVRFRGNFEAPKVGESRGVEDTSTYIDNGTSKNSRVDDEVHHLHGI